MNTLFGRALVGFVALTIAIAGLAMVALWAISAFIGDLWWGSLIVIAIAMVTEIGVYMDTLQAPIHKWLKEPEDRDQWFFSESTMRRVANEEIDKRQQD